jgi:hypothetical protein
MAHLTTVPATTRHIADLAPRVRASDCAEVWATGRHTPAEALQLSVDFSVASIAALADGVPFCIFGVAPRSPLSETGIPWLLGSDDLVTYRRPFLRQGRMYVGAMLSLFPHLENYVDARNTTSIEWLKWLGFDIMPEEPFGIYRLPFHRFEMRRQGAGSSVQG